MSNQHFIPHLRYEDRTFQLRLSEAWRAFLLQERAVNGKSMKQIVEEILVDHYNHNPAESEV